jgi:hypothetical protein
MEIKPNQFGYKYLYLNISKFISIFLLKFNVNMLLNNYKEFQIIFLSKKYNF